MTAPLVKIDASAHRHEPPERIQVKIDGFADATTVATSYLTTLFAPFEVCTCLRFQDNATIKNRWH